MKDNYTSGQVSKQRYIAYYKAVLYYLEKRCGIPYIEEDLSISEYKQLIDELLEYHI